MPHDFAHTARPAPHRDHDGPGDVPRAAIIAAGALIATTIVLAAASRLGLLHASPGPTDLSTLVSFTVLPAGQGTQAQDTPARGDGLQSAPLVIRNDATGAVLARLGSKQDPFLRTTLHALAARRAAGDRRVGAPFILARGGNGGLILSDPTSGAAIALAAFGQSNASQFAALLPEATQRQAASTGGTSP